MTEAATMPKNIVYLTGEANPAAQLEGRRFYIVGQPATRDKAFDAQAMKAQLKGLVTGKKTGGAA